MKSKKLLPDRYRKAQNQFSEIVRTKSKKQIAEWLQDFGLDVYHANLLSGELLDRAISNRIDATADTAPDVLLSDSDKIDSLVMNAKRIANKLDEHEELESLLGELEDKDNNLNAEINN
ncbi:hypothetical protein H6G36_25565 [Anabaena minutissima FACHB-250]|nr:hypothetical protein [Anabaena minutissima FACHB-250]